MDALSLIAESLGKAPTGADDKPAAGSPAKQAPPGGGIDAISLIAGSIKTAPASDGVKAFVEQYKPLADRISKSLGVAPEALLGQWGLETGWGKSVIPGTNNLGNIKDVSGRGAKAKDNMTGSVDAYRAYGNAEEFGDDFASLLGRRYKSAIGSGADSQRYFQALKASGYAEDPDYVNKGVAATKMAAGALGMAGAGGQSGAASQELFELKQAAPTESDGISGMGKALWQGVKSTARSIGATGNTYLGNLSDVELAAEAQKLSAAQDPAALQALQQEVARRKSENPDAGILDAVTDVIGAAWGNKEGTAQLIANQAPNSAVALGGAWAGGKTGAILGSAFGPAGTVLGGGLGALAGMFLGNALLETGGKAIEKAEGGFTPEEQGAAIREGSVKAGVITLVDAATLKAGGAIASGLNRGAIKAGARAEAKVLADAGINIADGAEIVAALAKNPALREAATSAGDAAAKAASKMSARAGTAGALLTGETLGEGVGEYWGELAATGKADPYDAALEAISSFTQSVPQTAISMLDSASNRLNTKEIIKLAPELAPVAEKAAEPNSPLSKAAMAANTPEVFAQREAQRQAAEPATAPANANTAARLAELESIGEGRPAQAAKDDQGRDVEIPAEPGRFFTAEEKAEYDDLTARRDATPGAKPKEADTIGDRAKEIAAAVRDSGALETLRSPDSPVKASDLVKDLATAQSPNTPAAAREQALGRVEFALQWAGIDLAARPAPAPAATAPQADPVMSAMSDPKVSAADKTALRDAYNAALNVRLPQATRDQALAQAREIAGRYAAPAATPAAAQTPAVLGPIDGAPGTLLAQAERMEEGAFELEAEDFPDEAQQLRDQADSLRERAATVRAGETGVDLEAEAGGDISAAANEQNVVEATAGSAESQIAAEPVQLPVARATPAGDGPAYQRRRRASLKQLAANGFTTVTRQDGSFSMVNQKTGQTFALEGAADAQMARKAVADYIAAAAAETNTDPTDGQKSAGNYKKARVDFEGLNIAIENPVGSERKGKDDNGESWAAPMELAHYGYVVGSESADGDGSDIYLLKTPRLGGQAYVIDQYNEDGSFDETKSVLGASSEAEALRVYDAGFSDGSGPDRRGAVTAMSVADFKAWANTPAAKKAAGPAPEPAPGAVVDGSMKVKLSKDESVNVDLVKELPEVESVARGGRATRISKKQGAVIEAIAQAFGKRVQFYTGADSGRVGDGFIMPNDQGTIYLNATSSMSPIVVFGHELMHQLKRDNPEAHAAIEAVVARRMNREAVATTYGKLGYSDGQVMEELISDLGGDLMADKTFWADVMAEVRDANGDGPAKKILAQLAEFLYRAIDALTKNLRSYADTGAGSKLVDDMAEIRAAFQAALAGYMQTHGISKPAMQAEILRAGQDAKRSAARRGERARLVIDNFRSSPEVSALRGKGLSFDMTINGDAVTLDNIDVEADFRGQGVGAKAMEILLDLADANGVAVDLEVGSDDAGIDLVAWYSRLGFVWKDGFMERAPQAKRSAVRNQTPEDQRKALAEKLRGTDGWLKAPNGKKTNLDERQWVVVRTPAFKAWFGDWESDPSNASKAVDENGEPKVFYHGSTEAGFTEFDTDGKGKTDGTGAFFTDGFRMAVGYSGTKDDAPVYAPEKVFANPDLIDGLSIEAGILAEVVTNSRGDKSWEWYESEETALEDLELEPGDELVQKPGYRMTDPDGYETVGTKEEIIDAISDIKVRAPGVYDAFLNVRDLVEIDWQGKNWDEGPEEQVWNILDEDGDAYDTVYSQEEADAILAKNPGFTAEQTSQEEYESTDDAARSGRDMGADGVLIKNVFDTGPKGYAEDGNVLVVYDPKNIKSATGNNGAFDPRDANITRSADRSDSPEFRRWFGRPGVDSNLVNEDGSPMRLYHGTNKRFTEFRRSKTGAMGPGIYLGDDRSVAEGYDGNGRGEQIIMEVYARGKYLSNRQWSDYVFKHGWAGAEAAAKADGWSGVRDTRYESAVSAWDPADIKSATNNTGEFGEGADITRSADRSDAMTVEGYHFSHADRPMLTTGMYGTGLRGSARDAIMSHPDKRLRQRLSFYFDKGTGIRPESGVGGRAHRVQLTGVYDADVDQLKLKSADARAFESRLLDAGYSGYMNRMDGTQPGQVIMLGRQTFTPELLGAQSYISASRRITPIESAPSRWLTQASGEPTMLQARLERMQASDSWSGYELRINGRELQARAKPGDQSITRSASRLRDDPMEVSSRAPWGKTAAEDPISDLLVVGLDSSRAGEKAFEKNVALVREYPNYRPTKSASTTERQADRFIEMSKDNLLWLHDSVPAEIRERSHLWYDGANKIAKTWAPKYNLQPSQIAGVMAVLSPQKDWFMNIDLARRVIDTMDGHGDTRWNAEMTATAQRIFGKPQYANDVAAITGKTLDEVNDLVLKAMWVRTYDETYNDRAHAMLSPEGDVMGKVMTQKDVPAKVAWGDLGSISKAVAIIQDGTLANISARLGGEHKVRNFYNNILVPNGANGHVTIDTHAVAAALLRPLSGSSLEVLHNFGSAGAASSAIHGSSGTYGLYAEAYRRAAAERGVLAREMQSITWEAVRGLFTPGFKSQQKNVDTTDGIWENYRKGRLSIENARQQILEAAGGIEQPSWFRPGTGSPAQEGRGDAGVVPGVQLPGRRAESTAGGAGVSAAEAAAVQRSASRDGGGQQLAADQALPGSPRVEGATGPDPRLVAVAEAYAQKVGIDFSRQAEYVQVDEKRAARIAAAYEAMEHAPQDRKVKAAYADLIKQTRAQYDALVEAGYNFYFADQTNDPYGGNPWNAMRDLRANQQMAVFPTAAGFGSNETFDPADNPLLADTGMTWGYGSADGQPMRVLANDLFRAVHDAFGHGLEGAGFRAQGEENAWQGHIRMFTGAAKGAITSETRGQNSWLNFNEKSGEANRTAKVEDTVFADQKTGLMPEWTWTDGVAGDMPVVRSAARDLPKATLADFESRGISRLLGVDNWAILTAENPMGEQAGEKTNAAAMRKLRQRLAEMDGVEYRAIRGKYGDNEENSLAVVGITEEQAKELGREFNQDSVLTRKGFIYQDGSINPATGIEVFRNAPDNYYSRIGDTIFRIDIDFDTKINPAQDAAYNQRIDALKELIACLGK